MATYRFFANMMYSEEIEVDADNYDEAFDKAYYHAQSEFDVYVSSGYTMSFDDIQLEDSYIPEDEDD